MFVRAHASRAGNRGGAAPHAANRAGGERRARRGAGEERCGWYIVTSKRKRTLIDRRRRRRRAGGAAADGVGGRASMSTSRAGSDGGRPVRQWGLSSAYRSSWSLTGQHRRLHDKDGEHIGFTSSRNKNVWAAST